MHSVQNLPDKEQRNHDPEIDLVRAEASLKRALARINVLK